MNDYSSPLGHMDGLRSSSPKRKRLRQKYAPKACVSCRRSKLKCTGENPCQRCIDNGKRCFYSEDQTAAEVLQNLSRPTPAAASHPTFGNSNGATRQHVTPRIDGTNRPPSDSGMAGATLEDRMARIEAIMEALLQERNMACTPTGTMEREDSEGCKSDMAFSMPILDPIHPDLDQIPQQSPELIPHPTLAVNPAMAPHAAAFVRAGNDNLPFPDPARYQQYVAHFFGDIHLRHPCVSESDFNGRTQRVVTNGATDPSEVHFLAVCFVVFACCDAVLDTIPSAATHRKKVPGWHWLQLADSVIDTKPAFRGCEDLALIQYHLFRALYLSYVDMPSLAYNAIRTACTAALQQNLHQQTTWTALDPEQTYWQLCVFWNVYIADCVISISCGRPASFHKDDISLETPEEFYNRVLRPMGYPNNDPKHDINLFLKHEIWSVQLATSTFGKASRNQFDGEDSELLATCLLMKQFIDAHMSEMLASASQPHMSHVPLKTFTLKRHTIPIIVGRRTMTSLQYSSEHAQYFLNLAVLALQDVRDLRTEATMSSGCRHQMTSATASALLVFGALSLGALSVPHLCHLQSAYGDYVDHFMDAVSILSDLAQSLPYARRIYADCSTIIKTVKDISVRWHSLPRAQQNSQGWSAVADLIPPGIVESFPYQILSPPLHGPAGASDECLAEWETSHCSGNGVIWLF